MAQDDNRGSVWRKWDLHVHTPDTKLNKEGYENPKDKDGNPIDKWDLFCQKIEESDVSVFGITDYFSVENYFIFLEKFKIKYPNSNKVFFPNVELRLEVGVNKANEEVNMHIIFSDKVEKEKINDFLSKLETNITQSEVVIHCSNLSKTKDFETAGIVYKNIKPTLKKVFGNDDCYLIFAAANNQGLRADTNSPRKMNICDEIDKICDGFIGGSQNTKYYQKDDRYEKNEDETQDVAKSCPVISGSDSHSFDDINNKLGKKYIKTDDNGGNCDSSEITWIKADPTFEGLKQIVYELEGRIKISPDIPKTPSNYINSIELNIPETAKVSDGKYDFCFSGNKSKLFFNPSFNCFIGGRGTGKSSLLSLLGLKSSNNKKAQDFWKDKIKPKDFDPGECISVDGAQDFEFIGQNEIEEIAKDEKEITKFIFNRISTYGGETLSIAKESLIDEIEDLGKKPEIYKNLLIEKSKLLVYQKEKSRLENIVKIFDGSEYKEKIHELDILIKEKEKIEKGKSENESLREYIASSLLMYDKYEEVSEDLSVFEISLKDAVIKLKEVQKILNSEDIQRIKEEWNIKKENIKRVEDEIDELLRKSGISEEERLEAKTAKTKISQLELDLQKSKDVLERIKKECVYDISEIKSKKEIYETQIQQAIFPLEETLNKDIISRSTGQIKEIKIKNTINESEIWENIGTEFYEFYEFLIQGNSKKENFKKLIFEINGTLGNDFSVEDIEKLGKTTDVYSFLLECFSQEYALDIFKFIRDKHLNDLVKYGELEILYGGKNLKFVSFGQRCTAAIVLFLLFGTKPIIIDEPEAHLDPKLIMDDLIPIIKEVKSKRQIIFATHNANFVINGDSEKIFILIEGDNSRTEIIETTIENLPNREHLLKLEGGKVAFEQRKKKYNF